MTALRSRLHARPFPGRAIFVTLWGEIQNLLVVTAGALVVALGYSLFQVPYNIAAGGIGGLSIIANHFTGWPVGTLYLVMNIPLVILGFFHLGRWRFVYRTLFAAAVFSIATDFFVASLPYWLPQYPITGDMLLSALYGGIVGGVGGGLIYRAGSTMGGTGIISRIIQQKTGVPLSQLYLYIDGGIILLAAVIFGWEVALYAMLTLFLNGLASDYTMEGPGNVRTAFIITNRPKSVTQALFEHVGHGVSRWQISGGYTNDLRTMLLCTVYRSQVADMKRAIAIADPEAFVIIGVAHQALGSGFHRLRK